MLAENPAAIDLDDLNRFESFRNFRHPRANADDAAGQSQPEPTAETPDAVLERAHEALNNELAAQLLDAIADHTPNGFEQSAPLLCGDGRP